VERKFFVAQFRGKYLVFLRTAQGSRTAPLTFCAIMAVASRLVQSVLASDHSKSRVIHDGRIEVYTDDPWLVARGTIDILPSFCCLGTSGIADCNA